MVIFACGKVFSPPTLRIEHPHVLAASLQLTCTVTVIGSRHLRSSSSSAIASVRLAMKACWATAMLRSAASCRLACLGSSTATSGACCWQLLELLLAKPRIPDRSTCTCTCVVTMEPCLDAEHGSLCSRPCTSGGERLGFNHNISNLKYVSGLQ